MNIPFGSVRFSECVLRVQREMGSFARSLFSFFSSIMPACEDLKPCLFCTGCLSIYQVLIFFFDLLQQDGGHSHRLPQIYILELLLPTFSRWLPGSMTVPHVANFDNGCVATDNGQHLADSG